MELFSHDSVKAFDLLLAKSERIAVVSHVHPDGDAVGSSIAISEYAASRGAEVVTTILPDSVSPNLAFISEQSGVRYADGPDRAFCLEAISKADLIIICDLNSVDRTGSLADAVRASGARKVMVDHHPLPQSGDVDICISQTSVSSASELMYYVLLEMEEVNGDASKLPLTVRQALMCGMTTDTNNFANSVFPTTLRMASELLESGVDRDYLIEKLYNCGRQNRTRAVSYILGRMRILSNGVAYMIVPQCLTRKFDLRRGELDGLVNMPLTIEKVKISILLKQENGGWRVSARAKRGSDVNKLCREHFNGGGHVLASGGRLEVKGPFAPLKVERYVKKATKELK